MSRQIEVTVYLNVNAWIVQLDLY